VAAVVVLVSFHCYRSKPIRNEKYKFVEGKKKITKTYQGPKQRYRCLGPFLPLGLGIGGRRLQASTALVVIVWEYFVVWHLLVCETSTIEPSLSAFPFLGGHLTCQGLSWASCLMF
jgi:hypothetical protein